MARILQLISRKRPLETVANHDRGSGAELQRCLTTFDLISLGIGSCCGAGMYLTAGIIASLKAGPGGLISFIVAGIASLFTGVHYAELAGICPHTSGSAYMYTYIAVGELSAFVIGWGLIVEYIIGTAAASVALSETFHSVTDKVLSNFINNAMDKAGLPHVDVIAAAVCLLLTWLLASGVQMSARVNNILNAFNFVSWAVFIGASFALGSTKNWTDHRGFFPFGYEGVLSAIPTAYYAFVGFDGLATTGAECKTPVKSIPIGIILSIIINIIIFSSVVLGLTFNVPYNQLPADTAMLDMFPIIHYPAFKYVTAAGAVCGLFAATFGSLFPLPRVLQTMSKDGLFFKYFAFVCPKRHTAVRATVISGVIATGLAAFVKLTILIELVLIGTLLAYVIVTFVTLVIRFTDISHHIHTATSTNGEISASDIAAETETASSYRKTKRKSSDTDDEYSDKVTEFKSTSRQTSRSDAGNVNPGFDDNELNYCRRRNSESSGSDSKFYDYKDNLVDDFDSCNETSCLFNEVSPPHDSQRISLLRKESASSSECDQVNLKRLTLYLQKHIIVYLLLFYLSVTVLCAVVAKLYHFIEELNAAVITLLTASMILVAFMAVLLMLIPQIKNTGEGFRAPLVPFLTVVTAGINIYLMTALSWVTWMLFLGWLLFGIVIYFIYGTRHSSLNTTQIETETVSGIDGLEAACPDVPCEGNKEHDPLLQSQ